MSGEPFVINSDSSEIAFTSYVKRMREEHKYITFAAPKIGPDRSIDQNSLFHVWLTEYAAHLLQKRKITPGELAGMKRIVKAKYYQYSGLEHMVHIIVDPFSKQEKRDYTSSKKWKRGEMFNVLEWLQMMAANDELVLESKGEHSKLKREQNQ